MMYYVFILMFMRRRDDRQKKPESTKKPESNKITCKNETKRNYLYTETKNNGIDDDGDVEESLRAAFKSLPTSTGTPLSRATGRGTLDASSQWVPDPQ